MVGVSGNSSKQGGSAMNINQAKSGATSSSSGSSEFGQNVFNTDALNSLYGTAFNQYSQGNPNQGLIDSLSQSMGGNAQRDMWGGSYAGMDNANMLGKSLASSLSGPTDTQRIYSQMMGGDGNGYANAMKQTYLNDATKSAEAMNSALDARAAGSGMSGGSRHGVAQALGYRDINSNLQNNLARTGYETFDKDLNNKLQIAMQADQGTLARQNMLGGLLGQQQQTMNQGFQNAGNLQSLLGQLPYQGVQSLAQIIGDPTILNSGSSSNNSSTRAFDDSWGIGNSQNSGKSKGGGLSVGSGSGGGSGG